MSGQSIWLGAVRARAHRPSKCRVWARLRADVSDYKLMAEMEMRDAERIIGRFPPARGAAVYAVPDERTADDQVMAAVDV